MPRLHLSTIIFTFFAIVPYMMIALPTARLTNQYGQELVLHGWPAVHLAQCTEGPVSATGLSKADVRQVVSLEKMMYSGTPGSSGLVSGRRLATPYFENLWESKRGRDQLIWAYDHHSNWGGFEVQLTDRFWSDPRKWLLFGSVQEQRFYTVGFLINLTCFVVYAVVVCASLEFLRRRKNRWFQFSLLEFGILATLLTIIVALALDEHHRTMRKTDAFRQMLQNCGSRSSYKFRAGVPVWLDRLSNFSFDRATRAQFKFAYNENRQWSFARLPYFCDFQCDVKREIGQPEKLEKVAEALDAIQPVALSGFSTVEMEEMHFNKNSIKLLYMSFKKHELPSNTYPNLECLRIWLSPESTLPKGINAKYLVMNGSPHDRKYNPEIFGQLDNVHGLTHLSIGDDVRYCEHLTDLPETIEALDIRLHCLDNSPIDLSGLSSLPNCERLNVRVTFQGDIPERGKLTCRLPDLNRLPKLRVLRLMPIELFDFDYSASNSLEYINIGQFGDSEITYAPELILWLNSLPNLKEITIPDSDGKINEKMVREAFPLIKVR